MKDYTLSVRVPAADYPILAAAAQQTHGGKVGPYIHTKAMEAARKELQLPPVAIATGGP